MAAAKRGGFLGAVRRGVTKWVAQTPQGRTAYADSSDDYNVGDLSTDVGDEALVALLAAEGVYDLSIQTITEDDFDDDWTYDTLLVSAAA